MVVVVTIFMGKEGHGTIALVEMTEGTTEKNFFFLPEMTDVQRNSIFLHG